eukprot:2496029-Lingulodinium_polyedra.AAC.1
MSPAEREEFDELSQRVGVSSDAGVLPAEYLAMKELMTEAPRAVSGGLEQPQGSFVLWRDTSSAALG